MPIMIFLMFVSGISAFCQQSKLDSLRQELSKAKEDSLKCRLLFDIGYTFEQRMPDSALYYYNKGLELSRKSELRGYEATAIRFIGIVYRSKGDYDKALELFFEALAIAEEIDDQKRIGAAYSSIGLVYYNRGNFDEAIDYQLRAAAIEEVMDNKQGLLAIYNNIGIIYDNLGLYDKAIDYHHKSLKLKEELGDKSGIAGSYSNIGSIHFSQADYDAAYDYHKKALDIYIELENVRGQATAYNNLGLLYRNLKDYNLALEYYTKSRELREQLGDKRGLFIIYNNLGIVNRHLGNFETSLDYYEKAMKISQDLKDKHGQSVVFNSVANLYIAMSDSSDVSKRSHYLKTARKYSHLAYDLAVETGSIPRQNFAANNLRVVYTKIGNCCEALKYAEIVMTTNDSLNSQEKTKAIINAEKKFQVEKKQLQIEKLEKEKALQDIQLEKQNELAKMQMIIIIVVILGLMILAAFFIFVVHRLKVTKLQKKIIEEQKVIVDEKNIMLNEQNEEIRAQHDEIEHQRDEIAAQRDMVVRQKEHIERQKNQITDSITYAKLIQSAVLPDDSSTQSLLGEHFILFTPKDIVSGDFYWVNKVGNKLVFAVADCTGHGVPGAFMSMLGLSFLKEIVGKKGNTNPAEILGQLRDSIIDSLQQKGKSTDQKDGMDMALCVFDLATHKLHYAGANSPLIIVKQNKEFQIILPDKQPIAYHRKMKNFTNNEIQLSSGDCIYIASDGYQNQLGGEFYKMFMSKNFYILLANISDKPMVEQKQLLLDNFEKWKGEYEQVDDLTIIGIRNLF